MIGADRVGELMRNDPPMIDELHARFYPRFERRWRAAEVVGRLAMLGIVAATLAGRLGGGPVAVWTRTISADGLSVSYQPVARFGTPTGIDISIPVSPDGTETAVTLPDAIVADFDLQAVTPQPVRWEAGAGAMRLIFAARRGADRALVHIGGMPPEAGRLRLFAQIDGHPPLSWSQFVLP